MIGKLDQLTRYALMAMLRTNIEIFKYTTRMIIISRKTDSNRAAANQSVVLPNSIKRNTFIYTIEKPIQNNDIFHLILWSNTKEGLPCRKQMGKQWKQCQSLFWEASKSLQMVTAAMKLKDACFLEDREGNGTQIQHSCLENTMDREAW